MFGGVQVILPKAVDSDPHRPEKRLQDPVNDPAVHAAETMLRRKRRLRTIYFIRGWRPNVAVARDHRQNMQARRRKDRQEYFDVGAGEPLTKEQRIV